MWERGGLVVRLMFDFESRSPGLKPQTPLVLSLHPCSRHTPHITGSTWEGIALSRHD